MSGLWVERLRCLVRGHTWSRKFRNHVFGWEYTDCTTWRRWLN